MPETSTGTANEKVQRKIFIDPTAIAKMKKIISLFADEIPEGAKEIEIISFFLEKGFTAFLVSGEIEKRLSKITGND
jgi:hypothetical protein